MSHLNFTIGRAVSAADFTAARGLFDDYHTWLGVDRCFGGFAEEVNDLRAAYAPPTDSLLLVKSGATAVGCGGFIGVGNGRCELKRMYVRPACRGSGAGRALARKLMDNAKAAGHRVMALESLAKLDAALTLYRDLGFDETGREGETGPNQVVLMEIDLTKLADGAAVHKTAGP